MSTYWIVLLGAVGAMLLWRLLSAGDRSAIAHREAQIRIPGRLAAEVGASFAPQRNAAWRAEFSEALVAYQAADADWWRMYRRRSRRRKAAMAEARVMAQRHVEQLLEPTEALRELVGIIEETIEAR